MPTTFYGPIILLVISFNYCLSSKDDCENGVCNAKDASTTSISSCKDRNDYCPQWAAAGECNKNPDYMLKFCSKSCKVCENTQTQRKRQSSNTNANKNTANSNSNSNPNERKINFQYGNPDEVNNIDLSTIDTSQCPDLFQNCTACRDLNDNCEYFGNHGECEKHPGWMIMNCGSTCKLCHMHDYYTRCLNPLSSPIDLSYQMEETKAFEKKGDVDKFFSNILYYYIVHKFVYNDIEWVFEVMSKPGYVSLGAMVGNIENEYNIKIDRNNEDNAVLLNKLLFVESHENKNGKVKDGPWVVLFDDFMSKEESDGIIEAAPAFQRSTDIGTRDSSGHYTQVTSKSRTSLNSWCQTECWNHPMVKNVMGRVQDLFNISLNNTERLQILEYSIGQYYKTHHDYIGGQIQMLCGPRILTWYMYLSDVEEGGETAFPKLGIEAKPKVGRAILWPSVSNDNPELIDSRTYHEAKPVIKGVKYGANAWFHLRDYQTPNHWSCTG